MTIFRSFACAATFVAGATPIVAPVAAATRTVPITIPLCARPTHTPAWSSADETFNEHRWRGQYRSDGTRMPDQDYGRAGSVDGNGRAFIGRGDHAANDPDGADDRYSTGNSPDSADPRGR